MSTVIGAMEAYLKLNIDDFEQNLSAARKQVESVSAGFDVMTSVGDKMTSVGTKLTLGLTAPVIGLGAACVKTTADFDTTMSKVSAISGATGEDLDALRSKAKEMGEQTKFSASEAGQAFTYMAMAGWDTQQMLDGISGIMNLAAADGLDLATVSDIVTDALTAFGLKASDAGHFADVLAKASSSANTNVSMLGESFKYVAPIAGSMGYSVEDVAVALGLMANSGIKAGQAGTAMRAALTRMAKPTKDAAALMEQYGISLSNSDGSMKSLGEVMTMLRTNMGNLTEAEQIQAATMIFGQEAMSGMLAIINSSDEDFNKLTESIGNAAGTAQEMADTMNDNLSGQLTLLKSQLESLALSFGEMIIPVLRDVVSGLQKVVDWLNSLDEGQRKAIITTALVVAAIGPVIAIIGKVISIVGKVGSVISSLKAMLTALNTSLAATGASLGAILGPILAVVAAVTLVVAAIKHLWETNEGFRNSVMAIWESLTAKFKEFGDRITDALNALGFNFENFGEAVKWIWDNICNHIGGIVVPVFNSIATAIELVLDLIIGIFDIFAGVFTGDWERVWNGIKSIFGGIWDAIVGLLGSAVNAIKNTMSNTFNAAKNAVINAFNAMKNGVSTAIANVKNTIVNGINSAVNWLKGLASKAFTWGKDMIDGFVRGIKSAIGKVTDAVKSVANKVKNFLHFSRPDMGPLRDYETWMPDMVDGLSKTLRSASPNLVNRVKSLADSMSDALSGGNYQVALAGASAGANIRAGGTAFDAQDYTPLNQTSQPQTIEKTEIHIDKIEVRDDHDLDVITQGMYNKQDQNLRALGRRSV